MNQPAVRGPILPGVTAVMGRPLRLLSIGSSYVVGLNRRLPHHLALAGRGRWEVTAIAPQHWGPRNAKIHFSPVPGEACRTVAIPTHLNSSVHLFFYGSRLRRLLHESWDLIHCWQEPYVMAGTQIAWLAPRKVPLVFWTAQNLSKNYLPPFCWMERYCLQRCVGWEACGRSTVEALLPRGYSA